MSLLVETIKIENGIPLNLPFHEERIERSLTDLFGIRKYFYITDVLHVPEYLSSGVIKCRFEYDTEPGIIEYLPYSIRLTRSLKLVDGGNIDYRYKYTDRGVLEKLFGLRGDCDDVLIIKNGMVTDTSYANVVLCDKEGKWITPADCLLSGTRRAFLLKSGLIKAVPVRLEDLNRYTKLKLINAMIGIDDTEGIPIRNVISK